MQLTRVAVGAKHKALMQIKVHCRRKYNTSTAWVEKLTKIAWSRAIRIRRSDQSYMEGGAAAQ